MACRVHDDRAAHRELSSISPMPPSVSRLTDMQLLNPYVSLQVFQSKSMDTKLYMKSVDFTFSLSSTHSFVQQLLSYSHLISIQIGKRIHDAHLLRLTFFDCSYP